MATFSDQDLSQLVRQRGSGRSPAIPEQELWRRFMEAATSKEFCESWLALQCAMIPNVRNALVLLGNPNHGPFTPAAIWPGKDVNVVHLAPPAERALKERRGLLIRGEEEDGSARTGDESYCVAYPIEISGNIHGAVVLEVTGIPMQEVQGVMRQLHWGAAWLEVMIRRREAIESRENREMLQSLLDGVAIALEHDSLRKTGLAFATKLATQLGCDRVSLGFTEGKQIKVHTLSHSAGFGEKMNLMRAIGTAMDEAVDQAAVIVHPPAPDARPMATIAHADLSGEHGAGSILTIPLIEGEKAYGAITLERSADKPFDEATVELVKTFGTLVGPIVAIKKRDETWFWVRIKEEARAQAIKFAGPDRPGLKLAAGAALLMIILFIFVKGDHRVRAPIVLEGLVQRAISAPFNGYVAEAPARPGDVLKQGALICKLDDRELKLERLKWATQKEQALRQYSEAMANHDRSQAMIVEAKADEAEAQVDLLDEQLKRSRLVAPFDGVVTSGDLSQSLGSPVERGQVLFEMAPLHGYRVIVRVDERDIGYVAPGQKGLLELTSVSGEKFRLTVSKVTPISIAKEGRTFFRVEAKLDRNSPRLRPGMEGVGKIMVDRRRLIWIWTHDVIEWIRLKLWTWWP